MLLLLLRSWQAFGEDDCGRAAIHSVALMRSALIIALHVGIENGLHLLDRLEPSAAALDAEVLIEQRAVQLRISTEAGRQF